MPSNASRLFRRRRGHRMRSNLLPGSLPATLSKAEIFETALEGCLGELSARYSPKISEIMFVAQPLGPELTEQAYAQSSSVSGTAMGHCYLASQHGPARVVVYRLPIMFHSAAALPWQVLLYRVCVDLVAHLEQVPPEEIDPRYQNFS